MGGLNSFHVVKLNRFSTEIEIMDWLQTFKKKTMMKIIIIITIIAKVVPCKRILRDETFTCK